MMKIEIDVDGFKCIDRKNLICLNSENHGELLIKPTPNTANGEWDMYLNDYKICSYGGKKAIQIDDLSLSAISELDDYERLGFYQEFIICQRQIEKKMIYKTDNNFTYNFNAQVVILYFEEILRYIRNDVISLLANTEFDTCFARDKYVGKEGLCIPNYLSYEDMIEFIQALLQGSEPYWKRIDLLDRFERETGAIIYKYGRYRVVSDLSKFLRYEKKLVQTNKIKDYGVIFTPDYISTNLRHKSGVKFTIGSVKTAISRYKNRDIKQ